jgi:tetratricopeptide (TPR) repeat protein
MEVLIRLLKSCNIIVAFITIIIILSCSHKEGPTNNQVLLIDSLINQARDSLYNNPTLAKSLLKKAFAIVPDSMTYYDACEAYATACFMINQYDSAMIFGRKTLYFLTRQPESTRQKELLATTNNFFGTFYSQMGKRDSAIIYLRKALQYNSKKEREPDILINLADQCKFKGDFANGTYYLRRALFISDSLHLEKYKFPIYSALGDIYLGLRDFETANKHYSLAEKKYKSTRFDEKVFFCNNRGNYYYYKEEYKKALQWFNAEKILLKDPKYEYFISLCNLNLSDVHLNLNHLDSCKYYLDRAEPYFRKIDYKTALYYINTIRIGLAIKQNDIALANRLSKTIKDDSGIEPNIASIRNKYLEQYYKKTGDYKNAYHYLARNTALNDSLRNDRTQKRIAELDMRYKQDTILIKKEMLIQQQGAEVETLKLSTYIWILVSTLIILGTILIYIAVKRKNNLQRMQYINQITKLRMTNIRNRISPHFMFNTLNREISNTSDKKSNNLYILAHLLRRSLDMAEQASIKLIDEIDFVKSFVDLKKEGLGDNFSMTWEIDERIDLDRVHIIPMMLQIPVENAIKHGLAMVEGERKLNIHIFEKGKGVRLIVQDNGTGYTPNKLSQAAGTGTGLKVLNQTIQILNSINTDKITFMMGNVELPGQSGAKAEIHIPYHYKFEYQ